MEAKSFLQGIKAMFNEFLNPVVAPPLAATPVQTPFKLQDGTDITIGIDDPMVSMAPDAGDAVWIGGVPAPAGDYTLEDGTQMTVDGSGLITVIVIPTPVTQPDMAQQPQPTLEDRVKALETKANTPAPVQMAAQTDSTAELKAEVAALVIKMKKQTELVGKVLELAEMLIDEPTADPKALNDAQKAKFDRIESKGEKRKRFSQALGEVKTLN